jgi:hypothetical protein
MRLLKRVLLFATEVAGLILGFVISLRLAAYFDSRENDFAAIAFLGSLVLNVVAFFVFRRKTRKWKIEQDAASWMANRAWRELHPHRARYVRIAHRSLVWLPSICTALVLFFLPVASHLAFSSSRLVPHYRLSVPLNWLVIKSRGDYPYVWAFLSREGAARYGLTPIWFNNSMPSLVTFGITDPASGYVWRLPEREIASGHTTHLAKADFKLGTIEADCWENRVPVHYAEGVLWEVLCSTRPNGRDFNLHASFFGHSEDMPTFYKVLRGAAPAD